MSGFIDIEDALQEALNAGGFDACAKPLPEAFACPHVCVDMLSAWDVNAAQALYSVDFECRAGAYDEAARLQVAVGNWVRELPGSWLGGVPVYAVDVLRMQRAQPDPANKTTILATVGATLRLRVA
jgi:hypothetical protein